MERYRISGVPITVGGKLVGIITNRDLRFENDYSKLIGDVMTKEIWLPLRRGGRLSRRRRIY